MVYKKVCSIKGNLLLVQSKKVHYVILFQKMLIIRKADSPNKIMHSISVSNRILINYIHKKIKM